VTSPTWPLLTIGVVLAAVISLSVHDIAIAHLHVPYPSMRPLPNWVTTLDLASRGFGMLLFCHYAQGRLARMRRPAVTIVVIALALAETLRLVIIETSLARQGWARGYWILVILQLLPQIVQATTLALTTLWLTRRTASVPVRAGGMIAVALLLQWALLPAALWSASVLSAHLASLDAAQAYFLPYPIGIDAVIYGTFIEPTVAGFALIALVWPALPGLAPRKTAIFTAALLLTSGRAYQFVLKSFWVREPFPINFLSTGQFLAEWITLGVSTAVVWNFCGTERKRGAGPTDHHA